MRSHALALTGIFTLGAVFNAAAAEERNSGIISLPACIDSNGENVTYRAVTGHELIERNVQMAMATRIDGHTVIAYDAARLAHTPPEFQNFVFTHECAHHQLDHIDKPRSETRDKAADCAAIKYLALRRNYGAREINTIADTDEKIFPRLKPLEQGIGWSVPDRRAILSDCLKPR